MFGHRNDDRGRQAWSQLEDLIASEPAEPQFALDELEEPVRRYLRHALADPITTAPAARIEMHGRIKLGRWLPFRATQLLAPRIGTVWAARVAGVIVGSDRYVARSGGMEWRLFGLVPVMRADGADVARSAAGRAAGESVWVPSALNSAVVEWAAVDDDTIEASFAVGTEQATVRDVIDDHGALRSSSFLRWGDPDNTGRWSLLPFGLEVTAQGTFDGVTIPTRGRVGWHYGTARWESGTFFDYTITGYDLGPSAALPAARVGRCSGGAQSRIRPPPSTVGSDRRRTTSPMPGDIPRR